MENRCVMTQLKLQNSSLLEHYKNTIQWDDENILIAFQIDFVSQPIENQYFIVMYLWFMGYTLHTIRYLFLLHPST